MCFPSFKRSLCLSSLCTQPPIMEVSCTHPKITHLSHTHSTSEKCPTTKAVLTAQFFYLGSCTRLPGCRGARFCSPASVTLSPHNSLGSPIGFRAKVRCPDTAGRPKPRGHIFPLRLGPHLAQARGSRTSPQIVRSTLTGPNSISGHGDKENSGVRL